MAKKQAASTPATAVLARAGIAFTLHPYRHDPRSASYGLEAAEALGLDPRTVFKTLVARVDERLAVAIVPVADQLDLKALARALGGSKAALAEVADAERATGYVAGGISPLGQRRALPTVVDDSAADHPVVYVSAGRRGLDLGIAPADLVRACDATLARVRRR